jgi:thiol-disulfide isomerase/thioredoxin
MQERVSSLLILLTILASGIAVGQNLEELRKNARLQAVNQQRSFVDFELQTLRSGEASLSEYEGEVVLLNFWATWCAPCRDEMPSMQTLYETLDDDQFEIVAVNVREQRAPVEEFAKEYEITFPIFLDTSGRVSSTYGARGLPVSYIIGPDGTVVAGALGGRDWTDSAIVEYFRALMGSKS